MKIDFFETVNKLKDCLKISDEELSNLLEVSLKTIKKWEDRTKQPRGDFKRKIINLCKKNNIQVVEYKPDFEFIKRICNLTCTENDLLKNNYFIKYDYDHPFEKYYNLEIITKAYNKLLDKSWSIQKFTYWIVIYFYIINGGFYDELIEDFTPLKNIVIDNLTYLLDGFSFIYSYKEKKEWESLYINIKNLDHILKTISNWKCVYTLTKENDFVISNFYSIFINDNLKECLISFYDDPFLDKIDNYLIKKVDKNEFIELINALIKNGYEFLAYDDEYLFDEDEFKDINLAFKVKNY